MQPFVGRSRGKRGPVGRCHLKHKPARARDKFAYLVSQGGAGESTSRVDNNPGVTHVMPEPNMGHSRAEPFGKGVAFGCQGVGINGYDKYLSHRRLGHVPVTRGGWQGGCLRTLHHFAKS